MPYLTSQSNEYTLTVYEGYNIKTFGYKGGFRWSVISGLEDIRDSWDCNDIIFTTDEDAINSAKAYIDSL